MKKKLESELMSIAHRILQLKDEAGVVKMHQEVGLLYEKLSVLKFMQEQLDNDAPTIGSGTSFFETIDNAFNNKISDHDNVEINDRVYVDMSENNRESIMEPAIEKIKDMVAQMPADNIDAQEKLNDFLDEMLPKKQFHKNDLENLVADFQTMPEFEPIQSSVNNKKSLNDTLKTPNISIGLNDKIAFIKHLFNGDNEAYDRTLSKLNTFDNFEKTQQFIQNDVKSKYRNWIGKEDYETRFLSIIETRF